MRVLVPLALSLGRRLAAVFLRLVPGGPLIFALAHFSPVPLQSVQVISLMTVFPFLSVTQACSMPVP